MTDLRKFAWVGLLGLAIASIGCGSKTSETGTGGSGGKGGSTGSGGVVDAGPLLGCPASDPPTTADIANFASGALDGGLEVMGGLFTYGDTPPPGYTFMPGSIEITDNVVVGTKNHYQGFGIFFSGDTAGVDCIDASSYKGVQFDISGSLMGDLCTMQFSINDSEHADSTVAKVGTGDASFTPNDPKASGPKGGYAPQYQVMASQIVTTPTTIKVPFMGDGAPAAGLPDTAIDVKRIEGVQWQMTTPLMGDGAATECDLDVTITNVKFYK